MRAALQIAGKRWDTEKEKSKETEKNNDNYQENNEEPWKGLTLRQRLDKISKTCNNAEKFLLKYVIDPARLTTTYDDVIIDDEVKKQVQELIGLWQLRTQAASTTLLQHIRITGALFHGAPGTRKTLLGWAIASDGRCNMLALNSANVKSKWVGESEKYIAAAFFLAAKLYPCVLFVEEVDALFYRRGDNDSSWERAALNQFLNEMDGLTTQHGENSPFIIAGTNRPGDLDDAFLRRLPHKVLFSLPSAADRERIFQVFLCPEDIDPQVDLKALARRTEGFSGSDIRSLRGHAGVAWSMEQTKSQTSRDVRVLLRQHHFEKVLKSTKATVSTISMDCLSKFAGNFNPVESSPRAGDVPPCNRQ